MVATNNKSGPSWYSVEAYSSYFDITTQEIIDRIRFVLNPRRTLILKESLNNRHDLYGPIWIPLTTSILLFVASCVNKSSWSNWHTGEYLDLELLSAGIVEISMFMMLMSGAGWGYLAWQSSSLPEGSPLGFLDIFTLLGYSWTPILPTLFLCLIPISTWQWIVFILGTISSCLFLFRNLNRSLGSSNGISKEQKFIYIFVFVGIFAMFVMSLKFTFLGNVNHKNPFTLPIGTDSSIKPISPIESNSHSSPQLNNSTVINK